MRALHTEWLQFLHNALRFGATQERAVLIANVLTYGTPGGRT